MAEDKPSALQSQVETMASAADRAELFQLDDFKRDFQQILTLLLAAKPSDIQNLLARADFDDSATKWATDPNATVVYVVKSVDRQPDDDDQHDQNSPYDVSYSYALTLTLSYDPSQAATLAFIKHVPVINSSLPLASQLHFLNLFGPAADGPSSGLRAQNASSKTTSGVYEGLHKLVHWGVAPAFDAFVEGKTRKDASNAVAPARRRADDSKDAEAKTGIPVAKKKFAELELSLLHLQQNVEIPDVVLTIHPVVTSAIAKAHSENRRPTVDDIDSNLLSDNAFLNRLQSEVNSWIKEIQNVTKLNRDVTSGTASQEINFWLSMEKALDGIEDQLRSEPIVLTLDILRNAKRFHATTSFIADTGLKEATDIVGKYNQLMKEFPLNELLAATDLAKIDEAVALIFSHINRKLKVSPYPVRRALPLVEAISKDLNETLVRVLESERLMYVTYERFSNIIMACTSIFNTWDECLKEFTNVAREVTRKRAEKFIPIKITPAQARIQERVDYLSQFRKQHHQLEVMVGPLGKVSEASAKGERDAEKASLHDLDMEAEVRQAYETIKGVDVLDVSPEGTATWAAAENLYNERVSRVENQVISRLRDRLSSAKSANEMFRVFSKFNALFVRPKIRGAIAEYQSQLIETVKEDIRLLHEKFKRSYQNSEAFHMSQLRDMPPIAGAILWAKQIERQLATYMKRVEDVLGSGWALYAEGAKLEAESAAFRRKLDTRPIYDAWLQDINRRNLQISGRLFDIARNRARANQLEVVVNFDPQIITLFKEVRNLMWLGFSVPHTINNIAKDAKRVYPHAVSLMETVRTYTQTVAKVEANPGIAVLVAEHLESAHQQIKKGSQLRWEHFVNSYDNRSAPLLGSNGVDGQPGKHAQYVREFASIVSTFQERTDTLVDVYNDIMVIVDEMVKCEYVKDTFEARLTKVQRMIDELNLEGASNLDVWVGQINDRIEEVLSRRLKTVVDHWCRQFSDDGQHADPKSPVKSSRKKALVMNGQQSVVTERHLTVDTMVHEIRLQNQVVFADPPIEHARARWYQQLQQWMQVICSLERVRAAKYEVGTKPAVLYGFDTHYASILRSFPDEALVRPFAIIENKVGQMRAYLGKWLQFQSLWDLEADLVFERLGDQLSLWQQLLLDIRRTRSTFDTSETSQHFGVASIDFEQVQSKVNAKYDAWQRDIIFRFAIKLGAAIKELYGHILKARHELEALTLGSTNTSATVAFITFVQEAKRQQEKWQPDIDTYKQGQRTLERYRFQFPADWLHIDQLESEWATFTGLLQRKDASIQDQLSALQMKIESEDKIVRRRIEESVADWETNKPIQGGLGAADAMRSIDDFEKRFGSLQSDMDGVTKAKDALSVPHSHDGRLEPVMEEIRDLKAVWTALSGVFAQLQELRDTPWALVQPRKIRQQLDALLETTRTMPSKMRQYAAFEHVQENVRSLQKSNAMIADLRSEALRERHWRTLYKTLRISRSYFASTMTLGAVWDFDLKRNEKQIRDVILQAQGEMALEEFLRQVKETWTSYTLDLVNFQNKTRLIRGWDDLFQKCSEHLNSLSAMRLSPYYKVFEEEASTWEERLNRVHVLFDVWIDVQRQWVYLEGIFASSADIKHLLPVESQRFSNINTEFLAVMKKVAKSPFVLDVLNIAGVQKSLERLADLLAKIQKALGEYLERERSSFPRFYFVGDEDLLEIIGNSKDIVRVGKFFKKMFAGVNALLLDDEMTRIEGMASREGEEVRFETPIVLKDFSKINDWLLRFEQEMKTSLALTLKRSSRELFELLKAAPIDARQYLSWMSGHPAQIVTLAHQIVWTTKVEDLLNTNNSPDQALELVHNLLDTLAVAVLTDLSSIERRKCESVITELVYERDVIRGLIEQNVFAPNDFAWLSQMRFYHSAGHSDVLSSVEVKMADASLPYGFEYLGVPDRLVQTPLTTRCYLSLTQALKSRLGGSPFGPAGTGKTESVKALGLQLGRFVLVFCCDETFDFQAMGRIFVGLCQVGAWGCFDEFNRLEERILSAVSQQIQTIQLGLRALTSPTAASSEIELVGRRLRLSEHTGIFITMNPGYAGRSNLPDNLKKLFRSVAMTRPDRELISQVLLFSQGFRTAEALASKIVPFFNLCSEQLSAQPHYDFGLRALKAVLVSAGQLQRVKSDDGASEKPTAEQEIIIRSVHETILPKLVASDVSLLKSLLGDVFPGVPYIPSELSDLTKAIKLVCAEERLVAGDTWLQKVIQLYQIQEIQHGVMMVGPPGTGKTQAWRVLLEALERVSGIESQSYLIDAKAIPKDALYGTLDSTTREWNDGLFTHILRKIVDDVRGESAKRHWIVFDGDVDPEWVENLNSVLDDNKLLTLPNGERLSLPPNVRIMFEVDSLRFATLATVSRCGMVWFSEDAVDLDMMIRQKLDNLKGVPLAVDEDDPVASNRPIDEEHPALAIQRQIALVLERHFDASGIVRLALERAKQASHIMDFTESRAITTLFSLVGRSVRDVLRYNVQHADFPLDADQIETFIERSLLLSTVWAFTGDCKLSDRVALGAVLRNATGIEMPPLTESVSLIDYDIKVGSKNWTPWMDQVPAVEVETHAILSPDVVIPTVDTARHEDVLYAWLAEHRPVLLCGPPGSGKTMTLFSALRKLPDLDVVGLNFSSATSPDLILKTFEQHCEYRKTSNGVILSPHQVGRWVVVFCDEINLPAEDKYGTQRVIAFLRQLIEQGGFWRPSDKAWVTLERVQFVGACNPPTDPGRVPLSQRFLRHCPLVMVDYPGPTSLQQIYGTFVRAILKTQQNLRGYAEQLTAAMVEFYTSSQARFTPDQQAHYVYSPRELTRWCRGLYESIKPLDGLTPEGLVRVWAHEALRLFHDRLVSSAERDWTNAEIDRIANSNFSMLNLNEALARPILFSNWTSRHYIPVAREELRQFTLARLRVFYEEELDIPLVLFDDVLDHVLRIDRVFRQVQGHLLLIGVSGSGKTTLSRFVAWMNGLSVFQIKVHNKYSGDDFDDDLRAVLRRAGCKGEKIAFIMDESNVLDSSFLERMNTLLANAEVPGLFEGDEYATLMTACKEAAQRDGLMLDTPEELYRWFTQQVARNLHVVFTMNPPQGGTADRAATSPALFNRCVLDWLGDWSRQALYQVGSEFTQTLDLEKLDWQAPSPFPASFDQLSKTPSYRDAIIDSLVFIHSSMFDVNDKLHRRQGRVNYATPRHYLDMVHHFVKLFSQKRDELEEQQRHLNSGLDKLRQTLVQVEEMRSSLDVKRRQLTEKDAEANDKLRRMIADQQEAEQRKKASLDIQKSLEVQKREIAERRAIVLGQLQEAEPAVLDAQAAVSNIKKQHLTEVRSMTNPPEAVKLAMESVCTVLGFKIDGWKTVQSIIRRDDFITSIVNFDTGKSMTKQLRDKMRTEFLARPTFNFESINRASKACGPLCQWVIAQVNFSDILEQVGPLRHEVDSLEEQASLTQEQASTIVTMIAELESRIANYKSEYASLISETQSIKAQMESVQTRVDRSASLLANLADEKDRWQASSASFEAQLSTIPGDVLISAAFLAYGGYFDQSYRESMWRSWCDRLQAAGIIFKNNLSIIDYLSTAEERLRWQQNSLPVDDLCSENAVILKYFNRCPLVIDPTGQAVSFITKEYGERKIITTSFVDEAFLKNLESALRFGTPILIQDVEYLDPILNPVLNRELKRAGGRVLVRLGNQDIDFSPSFTMFLATRDPSVDFAPDLNSRVTIANFSITRASLQAQTLNSVLKAERPEIDRKRSDMLKLQGEFRAKLFALERALLSALNEAGDDILENESIMTTLESLKRDANEIGTKAKETDVVMAEVDKVTGAYLPLARASTSIFFVLDEMRALHHFYQFSLSFFMAAFHKALLKNDRLAFKTDPTQRLSIIIDSLFMEVFKRASQTVLDRDRLVLAVLLCHIKVQLDSKTSLADEMDYLFEDWPMPAKVDAAGLDYLDSDSVGRARALARLASFAGLESSLSEQKTTWLAWINSSSADIDIPFKLDQDAEATRVLRGALLAKAVNPSRLTPLLKQFVNLVFECDLQLESDTDLSTVLEQETDARNEPLCLVSVPGHDASFKVESLVSSTQARCATVAMGSQEGVEAAEREIINASRSGHWVLLKNVHLASSWLGHLEKRLQSLKAHPNFRLFLTMEANPSIPVSILRRSRVLMNEPPPGLRANVLDALRSVPKKRLETGPAEKTRLYFLLAWFHAVLQERLRFLPLGWSKSYEFNDSDQTAAFDAIDSWLTLAARGRANLAPSDIPWKAIRALLCESIYGGKVDVMSDSTLLASFIDSLFQPSSYDVDFVLVEGSGHRVVAPDATRLEQFVEWALQLPEDESPALLALPESAERVVAATQGRELIERAVRVRSILNEDEKVAVELQETQESALPTWMKTLAKTCAAWSESVPEISSLASKASSDSPLGRFFANERRVAVKLRDRVVRDLQDVRLACEGQKKQTNVIRSLMTDLSKGIVPKRWQGFASRPLSPARWISDFARRIDQCKQDDHASVSLGLLFQPSAFITATRQDAAHRLGCSLEQLTLSLDMTSPNTAGNVPSISDLTILGCDWDNDSLRLNNGEPTRIETASLKWSPSLADDEPKSHRSTEIELPCWLDETRTQVLFSVRLPIASDQNKDRLVQYAVALCATPP